MFPPTVVATDRSAPVAIALPGQRLLHDIGHEMGTILMLASAVQHGHDIGADSRYLVTQLVTEVRRATELTARLGQHLGPGSPAVVEPYAEVRLDEVLRSIAEPVRLTSGVDIEVIAMAVTVRQNRLDLWRAVRNIVCNALDAVGGTGTIRIRLFLRDGFAVIDVDDDGPGPSDDPRRPGALGLQIVEELAAGWGGWYECGSNSMGGCRARLLVPLPPVATRRAR